MMDARMERRARCYMDSPLGLLCLEEGPAGITALRFACEETWQNERDGLYLKDAELQLREYFAGKRTAFDLPLSPAGTPFQRKVWAALLEIPYGEVRTYQQIAAAVGSPRACRAVGGANGANPIPILIPCHRVVPKGGGLGGYAYGADKKQYLLTLEARKHEETGIRALSGIGDWLPFPGKLTEGFR